MRYYLAGPVDFNTDGTDWKGQLKDWCKHHPGIVLFDPDTFSFGSISQPVSEYIHDINMSAIKHSDAIVARWMKGQISVGTPMELYFGLTIRKPIILITDMIQESVYINYVANKSRCATSLDQAYGEILRFDKMRSDEIAKMAEGTSEIREILCKGIEA
jgi:nucleoside 2-deoxyribosyltransferase